jgi:hypothetical protein
MASRSIECPVYDTNAGDRLRVAVFYGAAWRPVFWFQVASDRSIYLGPRYQSVERLSHGSARRLDTGEYRVAYADGKPILDAEARKKAKLSLHGSGIVNTPAGRVRGTSLRGLTEQQLLCTAVFEHPSGFAPMPVAAVRRRDVCWRYPIDESRPLWAHLYVAPLDKLEIVTLPSAVHQINGLFRYEELDPNGGIAVQLVFGHGPEGPWPPATHLLFAAGDHSGGRGA